MQPARLRVFVFWCISADPGRESQTNKSALKLGHYVGGGELPEEHVVDRLFAACETNGWVDDVGMDGVLYKIQHGLEDGKMDPKKVPQQGQGDEQEEQEEQEEDEVIHSGHLGMAIKLAQRFGNRLLYVHGVGWHHWDGKRFAPDTSGAAERAVHKLIKAERRAADQLPSEDKLKVLHQIARHETVSAIEGILKVASTLEELSATVDGIDADPWLFNCANGTLDLHTTALREHDPADRITKVARAAYRPGLVSRAWTTFLEKVLPDEDVRKYVQRLVSLSLLGEVNGDKQTQPIMHGGGSNGKSTLLETVSDALGDYATSANQNLLLATRSESSHSTEIAALRGIRLVTTVETNRTSRFDLARMKYLTGGDRLKARHLYQKEIEFPPAHLLVLVTNHLPEIDDGSEAVWRRIRVIPFLVQIPDEDKNPNLKSQLCLEADAVFTWIVEGWVDYRKAGIRSPEAVLVATNKYRDESDSISQFISEMCDTGDRSWLTTTKELYVAYMTFTANENHAMMSKVSFGRDLDSQGYSVDKRLRGHPRPGIRLKPKVQVDKGSASSSSLF
jgi:putative DNA primase/helicase